jgi:dTDP-4-dehydrorhamnose reductase
MTSDILVLGERGQLASAFFGYHRFGRRSLDITNPTELIKFIAEWKPKVVINCSAYTNVDIPMEDWELSRKVNIEAVENLAKLSKTLGFKLIHISTDYVFDGAKMAPYTETDETRPLSHYGAQKEAAEELIQQYTDNYLIIRTSWLWSAGFNNMVTFFAKSENTKAIVDHIGCLTHVSTVKNAIEALINADAKGIYHVTDRGATTPYEIASYIRNKLKLSAAEPILAKSLNRPATRPQFSALDTSKIKSIIDLPHWQRSIDEHFIPIG